jgi:SET domain-containing protein
MDKKWWETSDLGRYCNHSLVPNTIVIGTGNKLELISSRIIQLGEEILVDYRKVTEFTGYIPKIIF